MSRKELTRLRVLIDVADGRLSVANAAGLMGVGADRSTGCWMRFKPAGQMVSFRASAAVPPSPGSSKIGTWAAVSGRCTAGSRLESSRTSSNQLVIGDSAARLAFSGRFCRGATENT